MAKRSLLRRSNIEDFKAWLQEDGWQIEKTKGIYEVVRATKPNRKPLIAYTRGDKEENAYLYRNEMRAS